MLHLSTETSTDSNCTNFNTTGTRPMKNFSTTSELSLDYSQSDPELHSDYNQTVMVNVDTIAA